jgi:hypothetical protein
MSQSSTLKYQSTTAIVIETDMNYARMEYIDVMARPDLAGRKSGWIKVDEVFPVGSVVRASFSPEVKSGLEFIKTTINKI